MPGTLSGDELAIRRALVATTTVDGTPAGRPAVNGIDFLEVTNHVDADPAADRSELVVRFVHPLTGPGTAPGTPASFGPATVTIRGGDRVVDPSVIAVDVAGDTMRVHVRPIGDHSTYVLHLDDRDGWLDPLLASVPFSFLVECPTRFDCGGGATAVDPAPAVPRLDYLARDYHSLRRMMLDRLAVTVPDWLDRNPADTGVALVELLAHLGDRIAYAQDVVATEAYLDRARFRTSVARHLRLVDYHLHDGHNARVWIALDVVDDVTIGPGARFSTSLEGYPTVTADPDLLLDAIGAGAELFESVGTSHHTPARNRIELHTWMGSRTTLAAGSTEATLRDPASSLDLAAGDYLLLEQTADPGAADRSVDRSRRQVVRIVSARPDLDPLDRRVGGPGLPLVHVTWAAEDTLRFALPLGDAIAAARANLVLADHGRRTRTPVRLPAAGPRFRPVLPDLPVTFASPPFEELTTDASVLAREGLDEGRLDGSLVDALARHGISLVGEVVTRTGADRWVAADHQTLVAIRLRDGELALHAGPRSAAALAAPDPSRAQPVVTLYEVDGGAPPRTSWYGVDAATWQPASDLVRANADSQLFVVEVDDAGRAGLRFGDDETAKAPNHGTVFDAVYRVGSGRMGNVGPDTIAHLFASTGVSAGTTDRQTVFGSLASIVGIRNPVAAQGGLDPESVAEARVRAPGVFRRQRRAVTPEDYAARLEAHPLVQRALVRRRWTGSWSTLFCTVDLVAGTTLAAAEPVLRAWVEPWRTMGHDVEIDEPTLVPIELELCVGIGAATLRRPVITELHERLGTGVRRDGSLALFHPDRLTFGDRLHLSAIYAECLAVPGVVEVDVHTFGRLGFDDTVAIDRGFIELSGSEIAVLANDPNRPELGSLTIDVVGGR